MKAQSESEAVWNLIRKLREIEAHPAYQGVWTMAYVHGMIYDGPNYKEELEELEAWVTNHEKR